MKLVELKCKNCGAKLQVDPESDEVTCKYCESKFKLDDEAQHLKIDDMEKNGYEFEKGRIRAQQEIGIQKNDDKKPEKKKNIIWLIIAWTVFLPFTATYYIAKSAKLDKKKKIIIIVAMWLVFILIGERATREEQQSNKERLINCYSKEVYNKLTEYVPLEEITGNFDNVYTCEKLEIRDKNSRKIVIDKNEKENKVTITIGDETVYDGPIKGKADEKSTESDELFGKKEDNPYYDNEKNIRTFVKSYNEKADIKVKKVDWQKNHTIAKLQFKDETCKINDHDNGYIITCEFSNGKAKVADYELILKDMVKTFDSSIEEKKITSKMENAKNNNKEIKKISDKITIEYSYLKEAISIRSADSYIIEMVLGK